jgi:hypothetical protein
VATYEILNLDVWGNPTDGWDVNGMYHSGVFVDIPAGASDSEALKIIRSALGHRADARGYHDPWGAEGMYQFVRNDNEKPAYYAQKARKSR